MVLVDADKSSKGPLLFDVERKTPSGYLSLETSDLYALFYPDKSKDSALKDRVAALAVRGFLSYYLLQAGKEGRKNLRPVATLWREYPKILALRGSEKDLKMAYLMVENNTTSGVPAPSLEYFLENNDNFGRRNTPFRYAVKMDGKSIFFPVIEYSGFVDTIDWKNKPEKVVATVVQIREVRNKNDFDVVLALELLLAKQACLESRVVGGLPFCGRVWSITSKECFDLNSCDEEMGLDLIRKAAWAMRLDPRNDLPPQAVRFLNTCDWSRVRL